MSTTATITRKVYKCNKCNKEICFDNGVIGKNGRPIPLNLDSSKHQCANFVPASNLKSINCNHCKQPIRFDKTIISTTGKKIPLNEDGSKHDCPNSPYNLRNKR